MTPAQVRSYYERGEDLRRGRGVHEQEIRPRYQARADVITRYSEGISSTVDDRYAATWRRRSAPAWIPRNRAAVSDELAVILSQLSSGPKNWRRIEARQDGGYWRVTVHYKIGYQRELLFPDRDLLEEFGRMLNQHSRAAMATTDAERRRLERQWNTASGKPTSFKVDVYGSP
jgi:hypothetical protein